ncbi:MAG: molybdenum cofactor guanylyltransferase MobA [Sneathiella sp.]|nr:molybdenum cofactor guanylyltransferase MobA [Sneathiella sp.]
MTRFACVVLAGGLSRRMGGIKKYDQILAGKPLLQHVLDRLRPQTSSLVVNAAIPIDYRDINVIPDVIEGQLGPLAGVHAGLQFYAPSRGEATHLLVCPCDVPFLPADLMQKLSAGLTGTDNEIVMASSDGRLHPVISLWPFSLLDELGAALKNGENQSVIGFAEQYKIVKVSWESKEDPFFNINTPEDLALAETRAEGVC